MIAASQMNHSTRRIRLRPIALPAEHGGWGLLFEPIVLGLLIAPSRAGLFLSLTATAAFLARNPFKLAMTDWHRQRVTRRTKVAQGFAAGYAFIGVLSLGLAIRNGGGALLLPLLIAAPIAIVQLWHDSVGRSRALVAELAGSISTGSVATAIAMCGGRSRPLAFALWVIVTARALPTILYIRARLRLRRHKSASTRLAIRAHVVATFLIATLAWKGTAPWLALLAMAVLLMRAYLGLLSKKRVSPQRLGVGELLYGLFTVAAVSIGYGSA